MARLVEAGIAATKSGKVRLLGRDELDENWNPAADERLTVWETAQHLAHKLETQGETAAAGLLRQVGGLAEAARELAYRMHHTSERNNWAADAFAYNSLVAAWPELGRLAHQPPKPKPPSPLTGAPAGACPGLPHVMEGLVREI